ncbi:MAG: hypothetical protein IT329_09330 [Caldilineaceae bacterium]|nr:hypothetical protein [Caldilineaceae bacterium]
MGSLKHVTTHAIPSAPAAEDQSRYPVLIFLHGFTGYRQMNTFQVKELASHGYINAYSLAFFDRHIKGLPAGLLDGTSQPYPEVSIETRRTSTMSTTEIEPVLIA